MKANYYDLFDMIAEDAGKFLSETENRPVSSEKYSAEETIKSVLERIADRKVIPKKSYRKRLWVRLLIAAIIVLSLSGITFAAYQYDLFQDGAALITDENRDLVGKEMQGDFSEVSIYDKYGNLVSGPGEAPEPTLDEILGDSTVITAVEDPDDLYLYPSSIAYFAVKEGRSSCTTPEVIFDNNVMVVFTKEDGSGWHLTKGETLVFEGEEYHSEIFPVQPDKGQSVGFHYVFNHTLMNETTSSVGQLDLKFELKAQEDGEYYIGIRGGSSDPISLKEGKIYIR